MNALDPKIVAALQGFRAAAAGLVATGVPANPAVALLHTAAASSLIACYESLLGMPGPK